MSDKLSRVMPELMKDMKYIEKCLSERYGEMVRLQNCNIEYSKQIAERDKAIKEQERIIGIYKTGLVALKKFGPIEECFAIEQLEAGIKLENKLREGKK